MMVRFLSLTIKFQAFCVWSQIPLSWVFGVLPLPLPVLLSLLNLTVWFVSPSPREEEVTQTPRTYSENTACRSMYVTHKETMTWH